METLDVDYHTLLSALPGNYMVIQAGAEGYRITAMSPGYSKISLLTLPVRHMLLPELLEKNPGLLTKMQEALKEVLATGAVYQVREKHLVNGHENYWELSYTPVFNEQGTITHIMHTVTDITAELQIWQQERFAAEAAGFGTFELDLATNALVYSDRYLQTLGQAPGTRWNLTRFLAQIHPDDLNHMKHLFEEIYITPLVTCEVRVVYPDQSLHWIRIHVKVLYNGQREPLQIMGTVMNIANQRLTRDALERKVIRRTIELEEKNEELRRQKEFADAVLDASVDVIAVFDMEERFISSNPKHLEVYKVDREQIIGHKLTDVFPETINAPMRFGLQKAMKGEMYHLPVYRSVITGRYSELFCIPLRHGDIVYAVMAIAHDNTDIITYSEEMERKNDELVRSEERYHRMVNEVEDYAIILLDADGHIRNWNKGAEKIKGYKEAQILGKSFKLFYTEEDRRRGLPDSLMQQAMREGRATDEGWRVRSDGTTFWASVVITALHNESREIIGFSKVTRDLTERKRTEDYMLETAQRLEQNNQELARSNKELAAFSYVASHDLQEPLRKIHTFANYIEQTEAEHLSAAGKNYFIRMQHSIQRMQLLIHDLLAYSRLNTTERRFEQTNLNQLLAEVLSDLQDRMEEKNAVLESAELPELWVIPFQFRQLFMNLIINSLKFSREGVPCRIRVYTSVVSGKELEGLPDSKPTKHYHGIHFSDNGIGFGQEYAQRIFQIFQRLHGKTEYPGTGIGLAICQRVVQNHEGCIVANAIPGEGATFSVYIPVNESSAVA